ncbi:MAG: N-formylglutamate amidohydrolase [Gammaproteobacteria bacterium]
MEPFVIREPEAPALPVVVSIPHAGTWLPPGYAERLASDAMRALPMTDWHVPLLFDFLPALGVTVIAATVSRFVIDLNRPPAGEVLYPGRFETGLVPLESFDGDPVFVAPPTDDEIAAARRDIYDPYHSARRELLQLRSEKGRVIQLDLHSVTPAANRVSGPLTHEIMLGDRDGASCALWLTGEAEAAYVQKGFSVARNNPYKGGWITASGGAQEGVEALQIEMSWAAYMDPNLDPAQAAGVPPFTATGVRLRQVFSALLPNAVRNLSSG